MIEPLPRKAADHRGSEPQGKRGAARFFAFFGRRRCGVPPLIVAGRLLLPLAACFRSYSFHDRRAGLIVCPLWRRAQMIATVFAAGVLLVQILR
jgi:hypothetical protein